MNEFLWDNQALRSILTYRALEPDRVSIWCKHEWGHIFLIAIVVPLSKDATGINTNTCFRKALQHRLFHLLIIEAGDLE